MSFGLAEWMEQSFRHDGDLRAWGGFTHIGTVPVRERFGGGDGIVGVVLTWGLVYPDPRLWICLPPLVFDGAPISFEVADSKAWAICNAFAWRMFTVHTPPWPWAVGDELLDLEHDHQGRRLCLTVEQIEAARTVDEVRACINAYYDLPGNLTGGSLHIVLDDYGYGDESLRFCIEHAEATFVPGHAPGIPDYRKDADPLGAALGRKLLSMSLVDRAAANDTEFCRGCSHALSLHFERFGGGGFSRQGRCEVEGCDCEDGQP